MIFPAKYPQLNELTLTDTARTILIRALQVAFPHDAIPDGPYERTADKIISAANESTWFRLILIQGLGTLDSLSGSAFLDLDDGDALKVLKHVEGTDFFGFIRRTTVLNLYDDPEVWSALGYEGSSYDEGGYVDRGFDDLDWLPDPRVEEYSGDKTIVEVAPRLPNAAVTTPVQPQSGSSDTGPTHPGVAPQRADENQTAGVS